ncbi:hypothetical protein, partial [Mitsuokella sp.]|uniref:hypothetical protein n=1 Tax=Mitsuokella sp. TaxID=2049034 RepID=UPI002A7FF944
FIAEFYNRTEGIIDKNKIQDELIKELRELYLEFNEKGIDENIVREKVNYFLENNEKISDIILKLNTKASKNELNSLNSEMRNELNLLSFNRYGDIELPSDFYNNINFRIYRGIDGKINHNFNIDDVINGWRTIYISEDGNDANNGDTQDKPKKTLNSVFDKINAISENDVIIKILSPLLTRNNSNVSNTNRIINKNIAIVSDTETNIGSIETPLSWSKNGNCYQTTRSAVSDVWDKKNRDFANKPIQYKKVDTLAECQNTKGSWYLEGTTLYVRRLDDLAIDTDIMVLLQTGSLMFDLQSDVKLIFKNVNFLCTHDLNPNVKIYSSNNIGHFIGVNSNFLGSQTMNGVQIENIKHSWLFNCGAIGTMRDGFNYHNYLGYGNYSFAFEFNCVAYNNGIRDINNNNNNSTTAHDGYNILRIGCIGFNTKGPVLADVNGCYSINYDCSMYDSFLNGTPEVKSAYWFDDAGVTGKTGKSYLINCSGGGKETKGINTDGTAKVNIHNFKGNNVNTSVLNYLE